MMHSYVGLFGTLQNEEFLGKYKNAYGIMYNVKGTKQVLKLYVLFNFNYVTIKEYICKKTENKAQNVNVSYLQMKGV